MTRLYVGNIRFSADEAALRAIFAAFGPVQEVYIGIDRDTGRSRGFAFVTMGDAGSAQAAMSGLNGKEVDGRMLVVSEAQPRQGRGPGGGPGGSFGGGTREGGARHRSPSPIPRHGADRGAPPDRSERSRRESGPDGGYRQSRSQSSSSGYPGGGRTPKGGKPGGRDRQWDRDRDKEKFERDDEW